MAKIRKTTEIYGDDVKAIAAFIDSGFSTAAVRNIVSGSGIGMRAIYLLVESIGGRINPVLSTLEDSNGCRKIEFRITFDLKILRNQSKPINVQNAV